MPEQKIINSQEEFNTCTASNAYPDGRIIYDFSNTIFKCSINAEGKHFLNETFDNCIFEGDVSFKNTYFSINITSFRNTIFGGNVSFDNTYFESVRTEFINTKFKANVSFNNSFFKKKVRFYEAEFHKRTNFDNTKFNDLADFWNAKFFGYVIFFKTDFLGTTVFSTAKFHENVLFTYSLINKVIIFRDTTFSKGLDFSLAIIAGEISIFDMKLEYFEALPDTNNIKEYESNVTENGIITKKNKRETFRIIKNQLTKQNNNIDSLKYYSLEVKTYSEQLKHEIFKERKWSKSCQEYLILLLNKCSNNHGASWLRGVIFTLIVSVFFFNLALFSTGNYIFDIHYVFKSDLSEIFKYYFVFLLPTHNPDFMQHENPKVFFYILDFVGRVFISYGIYQTIQAFRKFKK